MINWIDIILIIIFAVAGIFGFCKTNIGGYLSIMAAAGFTLVMSVGFYEYLGGTWGDTSFTHGVSLLVLFILSMSVFVIARKRLKESRSGTKFVHKRSVWIVRITSGLILVLVATMFSAILMALMVKVVAWTLESDELSTSVEIFVNGVLGSIITKEMDNLAGYPAIIIGSVITLISVMMSNSTFVKRLSHREPN